MPKRPALTLVSAFDRFSSIAGSGTLTSHGLRAQEILRGSTYGTLFAYLWRRFGPPLDGWDDHKNLVSYYFETDTPGIGFGIDCHPSDDGTFALGFLGVSYCLSARWLSRFRQWEFRPWNQWIRKLGRHLRATPEERLILNEVGLFLKRGEASSFLSRRWSPSVKA